MRLLQKWFPIFRSNDVPTPGQLRAPGVLRQQRFQLRHVLLAFSQAIPWAAIKLLPRQRTLLRGLRDIGSTCRRALAAEGENPKQAGAKYWGQEAVEQFCRRHAANLPAPASPDNQEGMNRQFFVAE